MSLLNRSRGGFGFSLCVLVGVVVLAVGAGPAGATVYSDMLDTRDYDSDSDHLTYDNPLYDPANASGNNPLYDPQSITIFPLAMLEGLDSALFELSFGGDLGDVPPGAPAGAFIFDMSLTDLATGEPVTQFARRVKVQFHWDRNGNDQLDMTRTELGYYNEETMMWEAEEGLAGCGDGGPLEQGGSEACGTTSHFTLFYVGVPEPGSVMLIGAVWPVLWRRCRR